MTVTGFIRFWEIIWDASVINGKINIRVQCYVCAFNCWRSRKIEVPTLIRFESQSMEDTYE